MPNITTLAGEFKDQKELKSYCDAQYLALQSAVEKIKNLESEVTHLQKLLTSTTQLIQSDDVQRIIKTPELAIAEAQIEILQNRALQKELTLEEVKIFDLLVKNKRLLSGEATSIEGQKKKPKLEYSEAELVSIAQEGKKDE